MRIAQAQRMLASLGHYAGMTPQEALQTEVDGLLGPKTRRALRKFQVSAGLPVNGSPDSVTLTTLTAVYVGPEHVQADARMACPWLDIATNLAGTREVAGRGSNPIILDWADKLSLDYNSDDIPWCGLFVAHCISSALPDEATPRNPLAARSWQNFGEKIQRPRQGAVAVFWRHSPDDWRGHVGFYMGEDEDAIQVLGGNQSNAVNVRRIPRTRLLDYYWPKSFELFDQRRFASRMSVVLGCTASETAPLTTGEQ